MKLKHRNVAERQFKANGKIYFIEADDISIDRWLKYEDISIELQYGSSSLVDMHKIFSLSVVVLIKTFRPLRLDES